MSDDFVTRTLTLTVTARPQDFEGGPAGEDITDDLIGLLMQASSVTVNDNTIGDGATVAALRRLGTTAMHWLVKDDINGGDMIEDLSGDAQRTGLLGPTI